MRLAIIRLDALGDSILTSGFVRACREFWPDAEITMICGARTQEYWRGCPYLDNVCPVSYPSGNVELSADVFDLAINPRPAPDYFGCPGFLRKRHIGFRQRHFVNGVNPHKNFTDLVDFPWPLEPVWKSPFRLLGALGYGGPEYPPEVWPTPYRGKLPDGPLLAIAPGAGMSHKVWPLVRFASVARHFDELTPVLIGTHFDGHGAGKSSPFPLETIDLLGKTNVAETADVLRRCKLFIGNDSGPKHIAAAVGVPVVEVSWLNSDAPIFSYDYPFEPVGVPYRIVRPVRKYNAVETTSGAAIMSVDVWRVAEAARELLA